jgi:hypothetical protein
MCFFCKKLYLSEVFGFNAKQKKALFFGKVKIIRIKVKKVFLFKLKI